MATMAAPTSFTFDSFDGAPIAVHVQGEGRPTLLLHGFLASAQLNWFEPGIAAAIAAAGRQVIAPDLRAMASRPRRRTQSVGRPTPLPGTSTR
jgi:pimeloyl-ACP methyl ester carboxylesterase